jgi:predicted nucleic acid-binding protein
MISVDTSVFMYAVGRPHPLRETARAFFASHVRGSAPSLCSSAEVMQELMHAYLPVRRHATLDAALELLEASVEATWPLEPEDVVLARRIAEERPSLSARDLVHLASCERRGVKRIKTFDRTLAAAFESG